MQCINTENLVYLNDQLRKEKQRKGLKDHGRVKSEIETEVGNSWIAEVMSVMHGLHKSSKEYQKNQLKESIIFFSTSAKAKAEKNFVWFFLLFMSHYTIVSRRTYYPTI